MTISQIGGDTLKIEFADGSATWAYRTSNGTRYASAGIEADRAIRELWRVKDGFTRLQPAEIEAGGETKNPNLLPATQRLFARAMKGAGYAH